MIEFLNMKEYQWLYPITNICNWMDSFIASLHFIKNNPYLLVPCEVMTIALPGNESLLQLSIKNIFHNRSVTCITE